MSCKHDSFENKTEVTKMADGRFLCSVMIRCQDCHLPFSFVDRGYLADGYSSFIVPKSEESAVMGGNSQVSWESG
jgi:hypothetical protein